MSSEDNPRKPRLESGGSSTNCINIVDTILRHLRQSSQGKIAETFSAFKTNAERVEFTFNLIEADLENLLGIFGPDFDDVKDNAKAEEYRRIGNEFYKNKFNDKAFEIYTKSVALAPEKSANLGLAFANRSAVLYDLKLYNECLEDIKLALQSNYPENLKDKLEKRKENAMKYKSTSLEYFEPIPIIPDTLKNPSIPCASNKIKISASKEMGRHVIARKSIEIGEIIAIERAFATTLNNDQHLHCHDCLKLSYNLLPCSNCTKALYCSENCRKNAYEKYHKFECNLRHVIELLSMDKMDLMALKIPFLSMKECTNVDIIGNNYLTSEEEVYESNRYKELHNLVGNTEQRLLPDLFQKSIRAAVLYYLTKNRTNFFDVFGLECRSQFFEIVLRMLQVAPCNFHEITKMKKTDNCYSLFQIGDGAFPFLSMFNHSCFPNVIRECKGTTIIVRAIQTIEENEQLFDNYGCHHALMPKLERQQKLSNQYFFECQCKACLENWPLYMDLPVKSTNDINDFLGNNLLSLQAGNRVVAKEVLENVLEKTKELEKFKPCKDFSGFQEVLKQCYFLLGNLQI